MRLLLASALLMIAAGCSGEPTAPEEEQPFDEAAEASPAYKPAGEAKPVAEKPADAKKPDQPKKEEPRSAGPAAANGEGLTFEERFADAINKVRAELEKYRRW